MKKEGMGGQHSLLIEGVSERLIAKTMCALDKFFH